MPTIRANVGFLGQLPVFSETGDADRSDYRPVPASDRGNAGYDDEGMLGSYAAPEAFRAPADVRFDSGYGATAADLERGYCDPEIRNLPAYDLDAYKDRSTLPARSDPAYWEFQQRNERSRGFLTRPRIPTER